MPEAAVKSQARSPFERLQRRVLYVLVSRILHHPELLRFYGAFTRRLRLEAAGLPVARYKTLTRIFRRQMSFSNTAHQRGMPADTGFLIGMDSCPAQEESRKVLAKALPAPADVRKACAAMSGDLVNGLRGRTFDLVDDYLVQVVWAGLRLTLGSAATAIENHPGTSPAKVPGTFPTLFEELRFVGAHLIVGEHAPREVASRAQSCAKRLNARVDAHLAAIRHCGRPVSTLRPDVMRRDVVGLLWVGHPATVQAGALIMQDLIGRPAVYRALREQAASLGAAAWTDESFLAQVRAHVLESMRFRPPFPLLTRDVPRDTGFETARGVVEVKEGAEPALLTLAAMFDPDAVEDPRAYRPGRPDAAWSEIENRLMMFGYGPRSCIAKEQVVEILVCALAGLVQLPRLRWADSWRDRIRYDGPIIVRMRLRP